MKKICFLFCSLLFLGIVTVRAQYTVLHNFNDTSGADPRGSLTLVNNVLYGMTEAGGAKDSGCIFSIDTNGNDYKDILDFSGGNGVEPYGSLVFSGNKLYGMTSGAGVTFGNIFSIDTNGHNFKVLLAFNGLNGSQPFGSLTLSGNRLYGMTHVGGSGGPADSGCVFAIDTDGSRYKDLLDFTGTNGRFPESSLTLSGSKLYGMTVNGGAFYIHGCIFSIDTGGANYKDLHDFSGASGENPWGALTLLDNTLYGMTLLGGANDSGCIFSIDTSGSGYTNLFSFGGKNGGWPFGSLTPWGSVLYGMTYNGGANDYGCIFAINSNGSGYKNLYNFNDTISGKSAWGSLTFSGKKFYGMTSEGGKDSDGVIFSFKSTAITNSINELSATEGIINVYPNPNNGSFTLICHSVLPQAGEESLSIIQVYNVFGEQILTETIRPALGGTQGDNTVDISNQPNGIYLYRVVEEDGSLLGEGKLLIQK